MTPVPHLRNPPTPMSTSSLPPIDRALGRYVGGALRVLRRHRSGRIASAMAFDFFLALVPMLALGGWAFSAFLVQDENALEQGSLWLDLAPEATRALVERHFSAFQGSGLAPVGVLTCWWMAGSAFHTLFGVFEETFGALPRSYIGSRGLALGMSLLGVVVLALVGALGIASGAFLEAPKGLAAHALSQMDSFGGLHLLTGAATLCVSTAFLALVYRVGLRRGRRRRVIFPGAFAATLGGAVSSVVFGYYVNHIASYALFYGGLAVVVVLLLWLWLWSSAVLIGAEINVALEDARLEPQPGSPP